MNGRAAHIVFAAATLVVGLIAGLTSPAWGATSEVRAQLTLSGDIAADEAHQLFFDTANSGQTRFGICGRFAPACKAKSYELRFTGLIVGEPFEYRYERIAPNGTVITYFEGRGIVGEVTDIVASFRYGPVPDTAVPRTPTPADLSLVIGVVLVSLLSLPLARRGRIPSR